MALFATPVGCKTSGKETMKKTLRRTAIVGMLAVTGIGISPAWAFPASWHGVVQFDNINND